MSKIYAIFEHTHTHVLFTCLTLSQSNNVVMFYSSAFDFFFLPFSKKLQALNLILLTSSELSEMRVLLKQSLVNPAGKDLYVSLYASWCHSPMAIISLCFLAQVRIYNNLVFIATTITMFFFSLGGVGLVLILVWI